MGYSILLLKSASSGGVIATAASALGRQSFCKMLHASRKSFSSKVDHKPIKSVLVANRGN